MRILFKKLKIAEVIMYYWQFPFGWRKRGIYLNSELW